MVAAPEAKEKEDFVDLSGADYGEGRGKKGILAADMDSKRGTHLAQRDGILEDPLSPEFGVVTAFVHGCHRRGGAFPRP
jgi:hypothetical protein